MKNILLAVLIFPFLNFQNKFVSLFNGKDLTGWTIHGTEKWYVEKGHLICESGPDKQYGYLSTNKNYKNFILDLEFNRNRMVTAVCFSVLQ
jgi:Domain of Unknown Function (DUF1080)